MSYSIFDHPRLGRIRGVKTKDSVIQYLGLQYATLKDRFSRGELASRSTPGPDAVLDATQHGPLVMIPSNACEVEQKLIQQSLPFAPFTISDTECLTLNISAPNLENLSSLPVLFLVHGGGFITGSSSFPQSDLARLTSLSIEVGTPVISVAANYRVGAPGFLTAPTMQSAGYKPNNGLDDQHLALRWIQQNIHGFGGNPHKVTFLGQSAGAASGFFHLHNPEPLFDQFVCMSGSSLLRPRPAKVVEQSFALIAEALGAKDLEPNEQLQTLLASPPEEFVRQVGRKFTTGPIVDGEIIPEMTSYATLDNKERLLGLFPGLQRCTRVFIGDCQFDGMIWGLRISARQDIFPKTLERNLRRVLDPIDPTLAASIITAYQIDTSATPNTPESTNAVLRLGNDLTFALPASSFAQAWSALGTDVYLYHFNCSNPWDGPWKGEATHAQDLMFALQNYREHLAPGQQSSAETFAKHIVAFANGEKPFEADVSSGAMVYDASMGGDEDDSKFVSNIASPEIGRNKTLLQLVERAQLDRVLDAWHGFMAGIQ